MSDFFIEFLRRERHEARLRGLATYHLIAPLRAKLVKLERQFDDAGGEEQWSLFHLCATLRHLLTEREQAEIERRAA